MKKWLLFILMLCTIGATELSFANNQIAIVTDTTEWLYQGKDREGSKILQLTGHFGKVYDVLDESSGTNDVKIEVNNGSQGWVTKDALLISDASRPVIYVKKAGELDRKIIVVNQLKAKKHPVRIPMYDNPKLKGQPLSETSIFELRYLFAESDKAVLIGKRDRLTKSLGQDVLNGWIKKEHILEWNNRIGIEFDKSSYGQRKPDLASIFVSERDLELYLLGDKIEALYEEEKSPTSMPYYANRFPVLEKSKGFYQLIFIGVAYGNGKKVYTDKEISEAKARIAKIIKNRKIKLAILVDATRGMQHHINAVKAALKDFLAKTHRDFKDTIDLEVAIAVYRDYAEESKKYEIISEFTNDYKDIFKKLWSVRAYSSDKDSGVGAFPEALFLGMDETIKQLDWGQDDDLIDKYMILIGDHGNHVNSKQYPQDRKYTPGRIKTALEAKKPKIALYAIQVNFTKKLSKYNDRFRRQIRQIIGDDNVFFGHLKQVKNNSKTAISTELESVYKAFIQTQEIIRKVRLGQLQKFMEKGSKNNEIPKQDEFNITGYSGRFTQIILERYGIDPDMFSAIQACEIGYVSPKTRNGISQVEEKVLMSKREVELLRVQMGELAGSIFYYEDSDDYLEKTIKTVVKALAGDLPKKNETIANFIKKKSGIPIQTTFLNKTIAELLEFVTESSENRIEMTKYLRKKTLLLEEVSKEKKLKIGEWLDDEGIYEYDTTNRKLEYFFSFEQPLMMRLNPEQRKHLKESEKTHVWLPFEYLP